VATVFGFPRRWPSLLRTKVMEITFGNNRNPSSSPTYTLALRRAGGDNLFYSIKDLAEMLSLSERQVNIRIDHLGTLLDGHIRRGSRGKRMLDQNGLILLKKLVQIEKDLGLSSKLAVEQVRKELEKTDGNGDRDHVEVGQTDVMVAMLKETIDMLNRELEAKEREIERLHDLLNRQLPPPRGGWLRRLFTRGKIANAH